jgi:hypothetical protein
MAHMWEILLKKVQRSEKVYKALNERNSIQRYISRRFLFDFFQLFGFHITGDHFYEPIPNTNMIHKQYNNEPRHFSFITDYMHEYETYATGLLNKYGHEFYNTSLNLGYIEGNYYFSGLDAILLYCFLRTLKPNTVVEIGNGFSSTIILSSLFRNSQDTGLSYKLISLDPYSRYTSSYGDITKYVEINIHNTNLQNISHEVLKRIIDSDMIFVDSSHIYKWNSDVEFLFNEVYGSLKPGTYVHIHDIFTPYHYPKEWFTQAKRFWNEQYHLENFLRFNSCFRCVIPVYALVRESESLREKCSMICDYEGFQFNGASFYMQRFS